MSKTVVEEEVSAERELLEDLIRAMVDEPDEVRIEGQETDRMAVFDVHVANNDVGKVLGKKGGHAIALRTIFEAIYSRLGKRLHLQVVDPRR